jgi:hypothetical protein
MKCPQCAGNIGLFSKEMSELGKSRTCPFCGAGITIGVLRGRFALGFAIVAIPSIALGLSSPVAAGLAGGVGAIVGLGLKRTS